MTIDNEIAGLLEHEDHFLVVSHVNPDGDAIGSTLAGALALEEMGKNVWALMPEPRPEIYDFLPEPSNLATSPDQVPESIKWILSLDSAESSRIAGPIDRFLSRAKLINIDHHPTNPLFGYLNMVQPRANSTAEIIFELLKTMGRPLSQKVGICLYTGLVTDTGCFRFSGVDSNTFRIAAELLESGVDSYEVCRKLYEEFPPHRLLLEKAALERIEILLDGKLCLSVLYQKDFDTHGGGLSDVEGVVNRLRGLRGVEVGALITQVPGGTTKASLRSKNDIDVAKIAASLGGGGHQRASGLRSELAPGELKPIIIKAVQEALNNHRP